VLPKKRGFGSKFNDDDDKDVLPVQAITSTKFGSKLSKDDDEDEEEVLPKFIKKMKVATEETNS